jgi:CHAD domain-containing protein
MISPSEAGYDLTIYAAAWLEERLRLTRALAREVAQRPRSRAVHDVRVACRRLREAIDFFRAVPEIPPLSAVDRAARALARSVRRLRELDVARQRLSELELPGAGAEDRRTLEKLDEALKKRRRRARDKHFERIVKRAAALEAAIAENLPLYTKPRAVESDRARESHLLSFVETRVAEKRGRVETLADDLRPRRGIRADRSRSERLHAVRVAIKHWRYASEIARAVMPRVLYRPMLTRLRTLQELGGKSQDFADLDRIVDEELERMGVSSGARRRLMTAIRAVHRAAADEFVAALSSRVPAGQAADARDHSGGSSVGPSR